MAPAYFELSFCPSLELVSSVRRFVEEFYTRLLHDRETTSKLAIATHELLENAVKYSRDGETNLRVEIEERGRNNVICVRTKNRASSEHMSKLGAYLDEMRSMTDPFAYYQERMMRAAMASSGSELGLARIRCEAEMDISCDVEDDCVVIRARTHVEPERRA